MADRIEELGTWLKHVLDTDRIDPEPASTDASFRRYWRISHGGHSFIVMDAPPGLEDCGRFADLSRRLRSIGLNTPEIFAEDRGQGFLLLSDLGTRPYASELTSETADLLYGDAMNALRILQTQGPAADLPVYDDPFLRREMELFHTWFLDGLLGLRLDPAEERIFRQAEDLLVASALAQPRVCVHRDYHSRNLMVVPGNNPGILDFQDAVHGPITYDLVSLLRDCYIAWPPERVRSWADDYRSMAIAQGMLPAATGRETFQVWFDRMGMQRHLKACGIFARLKLRDGKPQYLQDIPRTLGYVHEVAQQDPQLQPLAHLLAERVLPRLSA